MQLWRRLHLGSTSLFSFTQGLHPTWVCSMKSCSMPCSWTASSSGDRSMLAKIAGRPFTSVTGHKHIDIAIFSYFQACTASTTPSRSCHGMSAAIAPRPPCLRSASPLRRSLPKPLPKKNATNRSNLRFLQQIELFTSDVPSQRPSKTTKRARRSRARSSCHALCSWQTAARFQEKLYAFDHLRNAHLP